MNLAEHLIDRLTPDSLREVRLGRKMELPTDLLATDIIFCDQFAKPSLDNVTLVLKGHTPVQSFKFNAEKFLNWCNENDILARESPFFNGYIIETTNTKFWYQQAEKKVQHQSNFNNNVWKISNGKM